MTGKGAQDDRENVILERSASGVIESPREVRIESFEILRLHYR